MNNKILLMVFMLIGAYQSSSYAEQSVATHEPPSPIAHTDDQKKPKVVVRRTPRSGDSSSGSSTDCKVKVTITSYTNFTSMTTDRGGGADHPDAYSVYVEHMYILNAHTRKPYITFTLNPSITEGKNVTDHRTGKKYSSYSHVFSNIFEGHTYTATLDGWWITKPKSITFRCPNEKGQREFSLPPIKHIGIMGDG